ncbi:lipocalin-like [Pelobates fuscus]|uniref:lipocalin-like n=1 Tax=Pelobates fuscus TaxID=191477 RepID=UPI002FE4DDED
MRNMLSLTLVVAACAWYALADVPIQPDFKDDKITGKWYSFGMASNSNWFQAKRGHMKMCTTMITPTADGNLEVAATYPKLDRCETKTLIYTKTDTPGRYTSKGIRTGSTLDIIVVETNYEEYVMLYTGIIKGSEVYTMVTLFGRTKEMRPELIENFKKFSQDQGLSEDNILILPHTDECMTEN